MTGLGASKGFHGGENVIQHIHQRLNEWAVWLAKRSDGGTGYRSSSLNAAMAAACQEFPAAAQHAQICEQDVMTVETAVRRKLTPSARRVIDVMYLGRGTVAQKARDLGCHRDTFYAWLHNAHVELAEVLGGGARLIRSSERAVAIRGQQGVAANDALA